MKMPILLSSYQAGRGRWSIESQLGRYLPALVLPKIAISIKNDDSEAKQKLEIVVTILYGHMIDHVMF